MGERYSSTRLPAHDPTPLVGASLEFWPRTANGHPVLYYDALIASGNGYGYRKIAALLRNAGWLVSDTRVERVWRREGLKVPQKQPKRVT